MPELSEASDASRMQAKISEKFDEVSHLIQDLRQIVKISERWIHTHEGDDAWQKWKLEVLPYLLGNKVD